MTWWTATLGILAALLLAPYWYAAPTLSAARLVLGGVFISMGIGNLWRGLDLANGWQIAFGCVFIIAPLSVLMARLEQRTGQPIAQEGEAN